MHPDPAIFSSLAIDMETITAWLRTTDLPSVPIIFALSASEEAEADRITLSCTGGSTIDVSNAFRDRSHSFGIVPVRSAQYFRDGYLITCFVVVGSDADERLAFGLVLASPVTRAITFSGQRLLPKTLPNFAAERAAVDCLDLTV